MNSIRSYLVLCRTGIALFTSCSAVTAYLVAGAPVTADLGRLVAGMLLLTCGASALNQCQERDLDARMTRTASRPLPSGTLSPRRALALSVTLIIAGLLVLSFLGTAAPLLGAFALLWYNGLYTALKRRTAFAAVYGAVVGTVPPAVGWVAGGGSLGDLRFAVLAAFFLLWQVPHFWLLLLRREKDYRAAGLPALTDLLGPDQLVRVTLLWTFAAALVPLLLPLFGVVRSPFVIWSFLPVVGITVAISARAVFRPGAAAFRWFNAFLAAVMALLAIDPLLLRMG